MKMPGLSNGSAAGDFHPTLTHMSTMPEQLVRVDYAKSRNLLPESSNQPLSDFKEKDYNSLLEEKLLHLQQRVFNTDHINNMIFTQLKEFEDKLMGFEEHLQTQHVELHRGAQNRYTEGGFASSVAVGILEEQLMAQNKRLKRMESFLATPASNGATDVLGEQLSMQNKRLQALESSLEDMQTKMPSSSSGEERADHFTMKSVMLQSGLDTNNIEDGGPLAEVVGDWDLPQEAGTGELVDSWNAAGSTLRREGIACEIEQVTFDAMLQPQMANLKMELVEDIAKLRGELVSMKGVDATEHVAVPRSESPVSVEISEFKKEFIGEIKKLRNEMSVMLGAGASGQATVAQHESVYDEYSRDLSDTEIMEDLHRLPIQQLEESVWDAACFIGLQGITITDSCLLVIGIALNALLQTGFIFILVRHMINNPYDEKMLEDLRRWKACQYTADQQPNTIAQPLPRNGGCGDVHLDAESVWAEVSKFFTKHEGYPAGWVMSCIAALAWAFAVGVEIRSICNFAVGMWCVPRGSCTRIITHEHEFVLTEITRNRVWVALAVAAMRLGIALNLLHWGTLNLIYQTDIGDLLLNACALAFILDIDSFVFAVVTPIIIARIVRFLEPLPLPKVMHLEFAPWLLVLAILAYLITVDLLYLRPFVHSMEDIIAIIDW